MNKMIESIEKEREEIILCGLESVSTIHQRAMALRECGLPIREIANVANLHPVFVVHWLEDENAVMREGSVETDHNAHNSIDGLRYIMHTLLIKQGVSVNRAASWLLSRSDFSADRRPVDLISTNFDYVLSLAKAFGDTEKLDC